MLDKEYTDCVKYNMQPKTEFEIRKEMMEARLQAISRRDLEEAAQRGKQDEEDDGFMDF